MAAPLAPVLWTVARVGAVAALAYYSGRKHRTASKHVWREAAMDDAPEGVEITTQRNEGEANMHSAARFKRTIRMPGGAGVEIDATALGRIRIRRN